MPVNSGKHNGDSLGIHFDVFSVENKISFNFVVRRGGITAIEKMEVNLGSSRTFSNFWSFEIQ